MLKERRLAAEQVASALFEAETAIDAAHSQTERFRPVMTRAPSLKKP